MALPGLAAVFGQYISCGIDSRALTFFLDSIKEFQITYTYSRLVITYLDKKKILAILIMNFKVSALDFYIWC